MLRVEVLDGPRLFVLWISVIQSLKISCFYRAPVWLIGRPLRPLVQPNPVNSETLNIVGMNCRKTNTDHVLRLLIPECRLIMTRPPKLPRFLLCDVASLSPAPSKSPVQFAYEYEPKFEHNSTVARGTPVNAVTFLEFPSLTSCYPYHRTWTTKNGPYPFLPPPLRMRGIPRVQLLQTRPGYLMLPSPTTTTAR